MSELPRKRYDENIKTRNWRLRRTVGTRTKFTLDDKRTGVSFGFDHALVTRALGRGSVIQLLVDDSANPELDLHESLEGRKVGSVYQHDCCDHLVAAFQHIDAYGELPEADYTKEEI